MCNLLLLVLLGTLLPIVSQLQVAECVPEKNVRNCSFNDPLGIYYVSLANSSTSVTDCPSNKICQPFKCYLACVTDLVNATWQNISMTFLPGYHFGQEMTKWPINVGSLELTNATSGPVTVTSLGIVLLIRIALKVESITVIKSSFSLTHYQEAFVTIINCYFLDVNISLSLPCVHIVDSLFIRTHFLALSDSTVPIDMSVLQCTFTASEVVIQTANVRVKDCVFVNSSQSALTLFSSELTLAGEVMFLNNCGINGGALALIGTNVNIGNSSSIHFTNNSAELSGGALFIDHPRISIDIINDGNLCFYKLLEFAGNKSLYSVEFTGNTAGRTGHHMYGASLRSPCTAAVNDSYKVLSYELVNQSVFKLNDPSYDSDLSSAVCGEPSRLCVCDNGQPMCTNASMINITGIEIYPGETFPLSAVLVGGDFGTTPGTVKASIHFPDSDSVSFASKSMMEQRITNKECTKLEYSIVFLNRNSAVDSIVMSYTTVGTTLKEVPDNIEEHCTNFKMFGVIDPQLISTPVVMHVTLRPCPLGFVLTDGASGLYKCDCHPVIKDLAPGTRCSVHNGMGYITSWDSRPWISLIKNPNQDNDADGKNDITILIGTFCRRCKRVPLNFSFELGSDFLCSGNHAGRLCGKCKDGYSLIIGSSHCYKCSNAYWYQVLWIVFIAAGIVLVLVISLLNLTVTQGKINGLVFYANVIWAHQGILFPQGLEKAGGILVRFLFWLNLDFGIPTCFIDGLDAFWKSWLQFLFPIYTATLFFIGVRFSSKLSVIFGDRTVPTLATLFFLSYAKLLRACIAALSYSKLSEYNTMGMMSMKYVWSADGTLEYAHMPHILLLSAAVLCLSLLWFPYVALLFSMQWLRRVDHHGPLKLLARFKPFFDACFGSLKDKHHYWFGVLLLVQGFLHLMSSLTLDSCPKVNKILVLFSVLMLLLYLNCVYVYKRRYIVLLESSFLINLALLFTTTLCSDHGGNWPIASAAVSSGVAFAELLGIVIWNVIEDFRRIYRQRKARYKQARELVNNATELSASDFHKFRDSILIA